ncbi:MDR family MFS transporter [Streptantibioticus ferralitis]|uniref:MFS transporter n=1 Tax=Streptantibioticus ferralitis TaxID=236510 RepID=A0ABT5YU73_9ACTN|nr:MFS transporter [Streptantibioticus ferralitis]MDF2255157.1 MFS transporter [Streptantibioticus ferralitis]
MRRTRQGGRLPRPVWLLLAARVINRLGAFSLSFLTVLISTDFGASVATAGIVSAAFGLATIPSRLAGGRLADRLGRRRTIVLGLTGCAVAQLGIAAARSLPAVAAFAVLLGLVFELYEPPSQAMIADAVGSAERVRAYSLLNAALAVGGMGAGLIAAGLGRWDLRWLFVADALSCLACAVIVRAVLPADRPDPAGRAPERRADIRPWRDRALIIMLVSGTMYALVHLQIMMSLPLSLARRGMQPADAGLLFTVSAVTIVAAQPVLRRKQLCALSASAAIALGYLLLSIGLIGYATAHSLPTSLVATVVWSLGDLLMMGRAYALVADLAPPGGTGRYLAVYGISWGIAGIAAPVLGTQILEHAGATALWTGMAALCLVLAVGQLFVAPLLAARDVRAHGGSSPVTPARRSRVQSDGRPR